MHEIITTTIIAALVLAVSIILIQLYIGESSISDKQVAAAIALSGNGVRQAIATHPVRVSLRPCTLNIILDSKAFPLNVPSRFSIPISCIFVKGRNAGISLQHINDTSTLISIPYTPDISIILGNIRIIRYHSCSTQIYINNISSVTDNGKQVTTLTLYGSSNVALYFVSSRLRSKTEFFWPWLNAFKTSEIPVNMTISIVLNENSKEVYSVCKRIVLVCSNEPYRVQIHILSYKLSVYK